MAGIWLLISSRAEIDDSSRNRPFVGIGILYVGPDRRGRSRRRYGTYRDYAANHVTSRSNSRPWGGATRFEHNAGLVILEPYGMAHHYSVRSTYAVRRGTRPLVISGFADGDHSNPYRVLRTDFARHAPASETAG